MLYPKVLLGVLVVECAACSCQFRYQLEAVEVKCPQCGEKHDRKEVLDALQRGVKALQK